MAWYGCLWKFMQIIRLFHVSMTGQVLSNSDCLILLRSPMGWSNAVSWHQPFSFCSSPVSSTIMCSVLMRECISATALMVPYSTFVNSQPSQRHWLISSSHCALVADESSDLQTMLNRFSGAWKLFGLTISLRTPRFFSRQHPTAVPSAYHHHWWHGAEECWGLQVTWKHDLKWWPTIRKSLWETVRKVKPLEDSATGCSHPTTYPWPQSWKSTRAVVLTSLLYGCESWTFYCHHIKQFEKSHMGELHSHPGCPTAGQNHPSWSPGVSQNDLHQSNATEHPALLGWLHDLNGWWAHAKATVLWLTSTRTKKTKPAMKVLQGLTEEQPEVVWHQAFWTQCSSPGPTQLVHTSVHSKCIAGKRVISRTACILWLSPQSCFCPYHDNSLPVSHLPLTANPDWGCRTIPQSTDSSTDQVILESMGNHQPTD